jgi:hypothetical protein
MNELLAVLLLAFYPFYFKDCKHGTAEETKKKLKLHEDNKDSSAISKEVYHFLHSEEDIQADIYTLFNQIMGRGVLLMYSLENDDNRKNDNFAGVSNHLRRKRKIFSKFSTTTKHRSNWIHLKMIK